MIAKSSTFTTDTNADATLTPAKIQLISDPHHEIHVQIQLPDRNLPVINLCHLNHLCYHVLSNDGFKIARDSIVCT